MMRQAILWGLLLIGVACVAVAPASAGKTVDHEALMRQYGPLTTKWQNAAPPLGYEWVTPDEAIPDMWIRYKHAGGFVGPGPLPKWWQVAGKRVAATEDCICYETGIVRWCGNATIPRRFWKSRLVVRMPEVRTETEYVYRDRWHTATSETVVERETVRESVVEVERVQVIEKPVPYAVSTPGQTVAAEPPLFRLQPTETRELPSGGTLRSQVNGALGLWSVAQQRQFQIQAQGGGTTPPNVPYKPGSGPPPTPGYGPGSPVATPGAPGQGTQWQNQPPGTPVIPGVPPVSGNGPPGAPGTTSGPGAGPTTPGSPPAPGPGAAY